MQPESCHKKSLAKETLQKPAASMPPLCSLCCDTHSSHKIPGGIFQVWQAKLGCNLVARDQKNAAFSTSTVGGKIPTSYQIHQTEGGLDVEQSPPTPPTKVQSSPTEKVLLHLWFIYSFYLQRRFKEASSKRYRFSGYMKIKERYLEALEQG